MDLIVIDSDYESEYQETNRFDKKPINNDDSKLLLDDSDSEMVKNDCTVTESSIHNFKFFEAGGEEMLLDDDGDDDGDMSEDFEDCSIISINKTAPADTTALENENKGSRVVFSGEDNANRIQSQQQTVQGLGVTYEGVMTRGGDVIDRIQLESLRSMQINRIYQTRYRVQKDDNGDGNHHQGTEELGQEQVLKPVALGKKNDSAAPKKPAADGSQEGRRNYINEPLNSRINNVTKTLIHSAALTTNQHLLDTVSCYGSPLGKTTSYGDGSDSVPEDDDQDTTVTPTIPVHDEAGGQCSSRKDLTCYAGSLNGDAEDGSHANANENARNIPKQHDSSCQIAKSGPFFSAPSAAAFPSLNLSSISTSNGNGSGHGNINTDNNRPQPEVTVVKIDPFQLIPYPALKCKILSGTSWVETKPGRKNPDQRSQLASNSKRNPPNQFPAAKRSKISPVPRPTNQTSGEDKMLI